MACSCYPPVDWVTTREICAPQPPKIKNLRLTYIIERHVLQPPRHAIARILMLSRRYSGYISMTKSQIVNYSQGGSQWTAQWVLIRRLTRDHNQWPHRGVIISIHPDIREPLRRSRTRPFTPQSQSMKAGTATIRNSNGSQKRNGG